MTSNPLKIPTSVEQIDREWFCMAMGREVLNAKTLQLIHGTATKVQVELTLAREGQAPEVMIVWVKTGLEPHSKSIGNDKVYAGETFFYRELAGKYDTRTPHCYFADSDDQGNSILVLDDLNKLGAKFSDPLIPASPQVIANGLEAIARYQAASWNSPELYKMDYLRNGGCYRVADVLAWIWDKAHWQEYSKRPRFQALAPKLRDHDLLEAAHRRLQDHWWPHAPLVMCHGDAHYGQAYTLPDGEVRLLDWQCVQLANHAYDVANLMVSGLSVADRRHHQRDLLDHYVKKLREFGVDNAPTTEETFQAFRAYALHGIGWVMCMVEMQPEDVCTAITERHSAAVIDLGSIDVVMNGPH